MPTSYYSKKMDSAQRNYDIYDKELLAIVETFKEHRAELTSVNDDKRIIKVLCDYKNLEYFMTTKVLSPRQCRWSEALSQYNFVITYRPGALNGRADALTRRPQDQPDGAVIARDREFVMLPPEMFATPETALNASAICANEPASLQANALAVNNLFAVRNTALRANATTTRSAARVATTIPASQATPAVIMPPYLRTTSSPAMPRATIVPAMRSPAMHTTMNALATSSSAMPLTPNEPATRSPTTQAMENRTRTSLPDTPRERFIAKTSMPIKPSEQNTTRTSLPKGSPMDVRVKTGMPMSSSSGAGIETPVILRASRRAAARTRASLPPSSVTIDGHTQSSTVNPNPKGASSGSSTSNVDIPDPIPDPEGHPYTLEIALKAAASSDTAYQEVVAALKGGRNSKDVVRIPKISPVLQKAQVHPSQCEVKDGVIFVSHRIWVPADDALRLRIVKEHHGAPGAGHPGPAGTLEQVRRRFYWPKMSLYIRRFVNYCRVCKCIKPVQQRADGLL
jgi:hypothetical protein